MAEIDSPEIPVSEPALLEQVQPSMSLAERQEAALTVTPLMQENEASLTLAEEPPLVLPSLLINRVVAGISGKTAYEFVELYNPNAHDVFLDSWNLVISRKEGDVTQEVMLHGTIKAKSYMLIAGTDTTLDEIGADMRIKTNSLVTTGGMVQLVNTSHVVTEQARWGDVITPSLPLATGNMLERQYVSGIPLLSGDTMKDFASKTMSGSPRAGGFTPFVVPVNRCTGVIISEIAANTATETQFIELHNPTVQLINLDQCLLQTNRSTTKSFILNSVLEPGAYRSFLLPATGLTLTKTTSGTVYLLSSDGLEETDARSYDGLAENTSWAWFGEGDWRQTFAITQGVSNVWQEFLACEVGYERNLETGRCRKAAAETAAVDCESGKYRNPETNRCRAVEAADILTPCKEGQFRSEETNRCRSLATATSTLAPCKPGQERNPDTNRCRNVKAAIPSSAFAVEPIAETPQAFMGWWVLGGIAALAVGYGVWEWRVELGNVCRRVGRFIKTRES